MQAVKNGQVQARVSGLVQRQGPASGRAGSSWGTVGPGADARAGGRGREAVCCVNGQLGPKLSLFDWLRMLMDMEISKHRPYMRHLIAHERVSVELPILHSPKATLATADSWYSEGL